MGGHWRGMQNRQRIFEIIIIWSTYLLLKIGSNYVRSFLEENNEDCFPLSILNVQENNKSNWGIKIPNKYIHFRIVDPVTPGKLLTKSRQSAMIE